MSDGNQASEPCGSGPASAIVGISLPRFSSQIGGSRICVEASSRLDLISLHASCSEELDMESVTDITSKSDTIPSYQSPAYNELFEYELRKYRGDA